MTTEQINIECAKLDGWKFDHVDFASRKRYAKPGNLDRVIEDLPKYTTSWDAIIPLIEKQTPSVKQRMDDSHELVSFSYGLPTPLELCIALLKAHDRYRST